MKSKRKVEFLIVLALVAVFVIWFSRSDHPAPTEATTPTLPQTATSTPTPETTRPLTLLDGFQLGAPRPSGWPAGTVLEFNEAGKIQLILGSELTVNGEVKVRKGDSHDTVKANLGKPNAFSHGGVFWGYWSMNKPSPSKGLLIKFSERGVEQLTLSADWLPLSTELALSGVNGSSKVVDGSDGYKDLREFLGDGQKR